MLTLRATALLAFVALIPRVALSAGLLLPERRALVLSGAVHQDLQTIRRQGAFQRRQLLQARALSLKESPPTLEAAATSSTAFTAVQAAIKQLKIVPFMRAIAAGKTVGTGANAVNLQVVQVAWQNKQLSQWIEDEFRAEQPGDHEHIPSNYMLNVIERASTEGQQWITLQNLVRSPTPSVKFVPAKWIKGPGGMLVEAHVGALKDGTGKALTVGMEAYHNDLRAAFDAAETIPDSIAAIATVNAAWMWNGQTSPGAIDPGITDQQGHNLGSNPAAMLAKSRADYGTFTAMLAALPPEIAAQTPQTKAALQRASR